MAMLSRLLVLLLGVWVLICRAHPILDQLNSFHVAVPVVHAPIQNNLGSRKQSTRHMVSVEVDGKSISLDLQHNTNLLSPNYKTFTVKDGALQETQRQQSSQLDGCHFHGFVSEFGEDKPAAISTCGGVMRGYVTMPASTPTSWTNVNDEEEKEEFEHWFVEPLGLTISECSEPSVLRSGLSLQLQSACQKASILSEARLTKTVCLLIFLIFFFKFFFSLT